LLVLAPAAALAHHGWSGYDASRVLSLSGVIREAGYEHPHGYVKLETPDKTWLVVLAPPSRMENAGCRATCSRPARKRAWSAIPTARIRRERAERITIGDKTTELR